MATYTLDEVYVAMDALQGGFKYGFRARKNVPGSGSTLGQLSAKGIVGVVFGANAPKPPRVRITDVTANKSYTTFCAPAALAGAKAAGWGQVKGVQYRSGLGGAIRKAYKVPLTNVNATTYYGQYLDTDTGAEAIANGGASLISSGTDAMKTIWGSRSHKPPKAKKSSFSFYCDSAKIDALTGLGYSIEGAIGI